MLPQPSLKPVPSPESGDPRQRAIARSKRKKFYGGLATYLIGVSIGCLLLGLLYQARKSAMAQRQQQQQQQFQEQQRQDQLRQRVEPGTVNGTESVETRSDTP